MDKVRAYAKTYREAHRDKVREAHKKWRLANPEKYAECRRIGEKKYRHVNPVNAMFLSCRNIARGKGYAFDLTREYLAELCGPMRCAVTGHRLSWAWAGRDKNPWRPSVDRIDPSKGYVVGNVRVVSWIYNLTKSTWTDGVVSQFRGEGP